jgi:two-component system, OmpR family, phosphate regulon sensor histidine kinase PhoR
VPAILSVNLTSPNTALQITIAILIVALLLTVVFLGRLAVRLKRTKNALNRIAAEEKRNEGGPPYAQTTSGAEMPVLAVEQKVARMQAAIQSLEGERNRSAAIMRSMVEGIAVFDTDEHIVFCNEAFAKMWNTTPTAVERKSAVEVIRLSDLIELIRRALRGEEGLHSEISLGEITRPRIFSVSVVPVAGLSREKTASPVVPANDRLSALVVMHEITDLRRLEQVRKDFVANVSHELRTPLTAIKGFAETLLAGALQDEKNSRRFVEIIRDHSARLSRLTDDLMKLSRIEAGKLPLDLGPVDLNEIISLEEGPAQAAADRKGIRLAVERSSAHPAQVQGDVGLLREVLRNLLDNAIQYTPSGGQIAVNVKSNGNFAVVTISDTGIGIPQAEQSRIFERFYRVDDARSREAGGTGLGLAIAKHVVESHGGRIWVESAVGEGSKFYFSVPIAA